MLTTIHYVLHLTDCPFFLLSFTTLLRSSCSFPFIYTINIVSCTDLMLRLCPLINPDRTSSSLSVKVESGFWSIRKPQEFVSDLLFWTLSHGPRQVVCQATMCFEPGMVRHGMPPQWLRQDFNGWCKRLMNVWVNLRE